LADLPVLTCSLWYKAPSFGSMSKHYLHASYTFIKHYRRASCKQIMKILQNTHQAVLIIYKSYATCFSSGARGKQWLSLHWSITIGIYSMLQKKNARVKKTPIFKVFFYRYNIFNSVKKRAKTIPKQASSEENFFI
jgi:hypothetical protein